MDNCPTDVICEIIKYNNTKNFLNLCLCDKQYNILYYNDDIWKYLCTRDYIEMIKNLSNSYLDLYKLCRELVKFKKFIKDKRFPEIKDLFLTNSIDCVNTNISKNDQITPNIPAFPNLYKLGISLNKIRHIPSIICNTINLKVLDLSDNYIENLNPEITKLINLEILNLSKNQLKNIPCEIFKLTNLKDLNLSQPQVRLIPKDISNLSNLMKLDLSNNLIKTKYLNIYHLINLTHINFANNQISIIPTDLKKLTNLENINFARNKLNIVPISLIYLTKIQYVDLSNNDFKSTFIPSNMNHINIDISRSYRYY